MNRGWYIRLGLVLGVLGLCLYLIFPSYYFYFVAGDAERDDNAKFCAALPAILPCTKLNLGLDLQGGVHLVMGVQVERAVEHRADRLADALRDQLGEVKLAFERVDRPRGTADVAVTLAENANSGDFEKMLRRDFGVLQVRKQDGRNYTLGLVDEEAQYIRDSAVEQTIKTIRNRADKLGVTEPTIAKRGSDNVLIQLPGVKDPERAIASIGRTAQLEFRIVDEEATAVFDGVASLPEGVERKEGTFQGPEGRSTRDVYFHLPAGRKEELRALLEPLLASNRVLGFGPAVSQAQPGAPDLIRTYVLDAQPGITGDYLRDAAVQQNPDLPSDYYVTMTFDPKGARIFADLTEANVQRHMAIVLDDTVNSAPIIQEKIGGGTARITLGGAGNARSKFQEAKDLSLVLKAGALPAPVEVREQRRVGQSLGAEAVHAGTVALGAGSLLVVLFMLFYYRGSGLIADVALVLNFLIIVAVLAMFEATLTLPGMAGVVLTLGMAVDANVIIFERIREELGIGKTPRAAIESGYQRAFSTILDSNLTTIIAGIVLMEYGSGPVRGFAVTLIIGVAASMFTAIVVTHLIYDYFSLRGRMQTLSI